jgi:hypothetical protein
MSETPQQELIEGLLCRNHFKGSSLSLQQLPMIRRRQSLRQSIQVVAL